MCVALLERVPVACHAAEDLDLALSLDGPVRQLDVQVSIRARLQLCARPRQQRQRHVQHEASSRGERIACQNLKAAAAGVALLGIRTPATLARRLLLAAQACAVAAAELLAALALGQQLSQRRRAVDCNHDRLTRSSDLHYTIQSHMQRLVKVLPRLGVSQRIVQDAVCINVQVVDAKAAEGEVAVLMLALKPVGVAWDAHFRVLQSARSQQTP
mmetsp:Transcript_26062/g.77322  ORF Transcript_26062/g.77322 Transcript_26062/m.77322 type:complete len:214 (-) Transcript_26062:226-867(-)